MNGQVLFLLVMFLALLRGEIIYLLRQKSEETEFLALGGEKAKKPVPDFFTLRFLSLPWVCGKCCLLWENGRKFGAYLRSNREAS